MNAYQVSRQALRASIRRSATPQTRAYTKILSGAIRNHIQTPFLLSTVPAPRSFQSYAPNAAVKLPETGIAQPEPEEHEEETPTQKSEIDIEEYHQRSDVYLEALVSKLEQRQEEKGDLDVDYSAGVLSIDFGEKGHYVLNKQPPNRQIWLSSPVSGPKRFDWVLFSEGQNTKEGSGVGDWIYLRDGSSLTEILKKEIGVEPGLEAEGLEA